MDELGLTLPRRGFLRGVAVAAAAIALPKTVEAATLLPGTQAVLHASDLSSRASGDFLVEYFNDEFDAKCKSNEIFEVQLATCQTLVGIKGDSSDAVSRRTKDEIATHVNKVLELMRDYNEALNTKIDEYEVEVNDRELDYLRSYDRRTMTVDTFCQRALGLADQYLAFKKSLVRDSKFSREQIDELLRLFHSNSGFDENPERLSPEGSLYSLAELCKLVGSKLNPEQVLLLARRPSGLVFRQCSVFFKTDKFESVRHLPARILAPFSDYGSSRGVGNEISFSQRLDLFEAAKKTEILFRQGQISEIERLRTYHPIAVKLNKNGWANWVVDTARSGCQIVEDWIP